MIIENDYKTRNTNNILTNIEEVKKEVTKFESLEPELKKARDSYRERFFVSEVKKEKNKKDNIKVYFFVTIFFLFGFLIGIITFKNLVKENDIRERICSYDFFYEETEIEKEAFLVNKLYGKTLIILILWIVGISIIGAPLLLFLCACRGFILSVITSSILLKYGIKEGYKLLLTQMFLPTFLTEIVIIFLTVSSLKVMFDILCERKQLKEEIVRHSILAVIGAVTMFAGIMFECRMVLNNFT